MIDTKALRELCEQARANVFCRPALRNAAPELLDAYDESTLLRQENQTLKRELAAVRARMERKDAALREMGRIEALVQYIGNRNLADWPSPHEWRTMAAFDSLDVAERYAKGWGEKNTARWEYRAIARAALQDNK